ncbi:MAG: phosphoenolpyruvate synthase [Chloroflexota bacterium]|nr:phosphoenolpyruvate synthase [Chloroflexota bacterium]
MTGKRKNLVWFNEVGKNDIDLVGGKGANLGELTKAAIPVPPGFIITTESYFHFLEETGLHQQIKDSLEPLDTDNSEQLSQVSSQIKDAMIKAVMPVHISNEIKEAYKKLGGLVAVRSSATSEDLPDASFAGQQSTFLNIQDEDDVLIAVQKCWASLFESRAIFYRNEKGIEHVRVGIAVPVQRMVQSETSGVMFTVEPLTNDNKITIEAIYGLGEAIVSGEVTPDLYLVSKDDFTIEDKQIANQEWQLVKRPGVHKIIEETNVRLPVSAAVQRKQKLRDSEIITLAKLGTKIEALYKFPQDIEWAKADGVLYIVQSRPVTTLKNVSNEEQAELSHATVLLTGSPASPGLGFGNVKIILDPSRIDEVSKGSILVAEMTTPDFVPAMKKAAGIVTDRGGRTCHAAIVSRELGVPCTVGTGEATKVLNPGQEVTVDGSKGRVYAGKVIAKVVNSPTTHYDKTIKTHTKLYVNLAEPELAETVAVQNIDGVGLLRAEFMIAQIGEHPRYMLKEGRGEEFTSALAQGLTTFTSAFAPRPVVYRATDLKTNEYRNLKGGQEYEEYEENPMLGYRGCSRYIKELDIFKLEIEAVKRVRRSYKNLWLMIPFVRTVAELSAIKDILAAEGLRRSRDFKLWMMVEVPSTVFLIDKFLNVGIDGVSIGSNDLTQLIMGIDRDSEKLADDFDERNEAVLAAIEKVIKAAAARGVTCSVCGQAPSVYPELTEKFVEWGITSISVNRDRIDETRQIIAAAEDRLAKTYSTG